MAEERNGAPALPTDDDLRQAGEAIVQAEVQKEVKKQGWKIGRWLAGRLGGMKAVKQYDGEVKKP